MEAVCVGSATIDVFVLLHSLERFSYDKFSNQISFSLGDKVPLDEFKLALGGNACNVSVGLSRLGIQASLVAEIGTDEFAKKIESVLEAEKVKVDSLTKNPDKNEHFNIILSYDGDRTILEEKAPLEQKIGEVNSNPDLIYLTSLAGDWKATYDRTFTANPNSKFAFNPGPRQITEGRNAILEILPRIDVLFVNLAEAKEIIGEDLTDIKSLLNKLNELGVKIVVITDGRNGSYCMANGKSLHIESADTEKPKERTGAGDAYSSGFLLGYLTGRETEECMKYGATNAESVISKIGAQEGLLTMTQLEQALAENQLNAMEI